MAKVVLIPFAGYYLVNSDGSLGGRLDRDDPIVIKAKREGPISQGKPQHQESAARQVFPDELQAVATGLESLRTTFESFKKDIPSRQDIAEFENSLKDLEAKANGLQTTLSKIGNVDDLLKKVQGLITELQRINDEQSSWRKTIESRLAAFEQRSKTDTPKPSEPPRGDVGQKESVMTYRNFAIAATVVIAFLVGALFFITRSGDTGSALSERRVADIAGATFDLRIKPVVDDVAKLNKRTTDMSDAIGALDTKVAKVENKMDSANAGIEKLLKRMDGAPGTTTPSAPAMSALEQQRWATVRAECLPEDQKPQGKELNLKDDLDDSSFQALIAHCKANKMATQRVVSPPPAAGRPQVAQNDPQDDPEADEDQDAQAPGQPRAQPVGYGGGHRQGKRRCPPGTEPAGSFGCVGQTITNRAETRVFDTNIRSGCVQGATQTIWKKGVDQQGRNVRYKIDQHTECRGQHRQ